MNGPLYEFATFILQTAKAHNVTIDGGEKYHVPSNKVTVDQTTFGSFSAMTGRDTSQNLTSYSMTAISGADDFEDDNETIKDLFDIVVSNTREVSPTCKSSSLTRPFVHFTHLARIKSERSGLLGTHKKVPSLRAY